MLDFPWVFLPFLVPRSSVFDVFWEVIVIGDIELGVFCIRESSEGCVCCAYIWDSMDIIFNETYIYMHLSILYSIHSIYAHIRHFRCCNFKPLRQPFTSKKGRKKNSPRCPAPRMGPSVSSWSQIGPRVIPARWEPFCCSKLDTVDGRNPAFTSWG